MFGQKFFPYSTLQELNLDWILTKVKNILRFVPDDGYVGQILRRTKDGAEWSDEQGGGGAVNSVNGKTGTVVLTASDVGALPDSYTPPVTSVNTKTGAVVLDKTDVGLGNVANVAQYSASNPPPYPVTSVNGLTGDIVISIPQGISIVKTQTPTQAQLQTALFLVARLDHTQSASFCQIIDFVGDGNPPVSNQDYGGQYRTAAIYWNKTNGTLVASADNTIDWVMLAFSN